MKRFLATLIAAVVAPAATAQAPPPPRELIDSVSVVGTGRSVVTPDRFSFTLGVQTVANTVDDAVAENNRRVTDVLAALKKAGAAEKDIQTSGFSIWPQQHFEEGRPPRILGYQVNNHITVRSSKIGEAGRLLGVGIAAGVNTASALNFEVSDVARGRDQGLRAAFDDARARATLLASAAGRTLGRAIVINEGAPNFIQPPIPLQRAMAMEGRAGPDVPVEAGTEEARYTITVMFELR